MLNLTYLQALTAMENLLSKVGVSHWRDSIRMDIQRWNDFKDAKSHLNSYGGMGSFNDVLICEENGHQVTRIQQPWVNTLFDWLKNLCYQLAKDPRHELSLEAIIDETGPSDPCIAAFWSPNEAETKRRQAEHRQKTNNKISGERCLQCGYGEVSAASIDWYLSKEIIPKMLMAEQNLTTAIEKILKVDVPNIQTWRNEISAKLIKSGVAIHLKGRDLRPCPKCGSRDTAVYRWSPTKDGQGYEPSDDNLALRKK